MSDLNTVFPMFVFITLVVVLTSFFVIVDNEFFLTDVQDPKIPFKPVGVGDDYDNSSNVTSDLENETLVQEDSGDFWTFIGQIASVGLTFTGLLTLPFTPWAAIPLITGFTGSLFSFPGVGEFLSSMPVIGNIIGGMNYVATAFGSFAGLMTYSLPFFEGFPIFAALIGAPICFFFFIFIIRFIRGQ